MWEYNELCHAGVKGMKWGVRRYQNKDGSLTDAGKRRYARDQRENAGKKKSNKVGEADPNRWVREDLERTKKVANSSEELTRNIQRLNKATDIRKPRERMDLSSMSDKEMRDKINRELLERQYNDVFNPQVESRGREYVRNTMEVAGSVLAITGSALGIALAVKELTGR